MEPTAICTSYVRILLTFELRNINGRIENPKVHIVISTWCLLEITYYCLLILFIFTKSIKLLLQFFFQDGSNRCCVITDYVHYHQTKLDLRYCTPIFCYQFHFPQKHHTVAEY